jgi:hypothetical protein
MPDHLIVDTDICPECQERRLILFKRDDPSAAPIIQQISCPNGCVSSLDPARNPA